MLLFFHDAIHITQRSPKYNVYLAFLGHVTHFPPITLGIIIVSKMAFNRYDVLFDKTIWYFHLSEYQYSPRPGAANPEEWDTDNTYRQISNIRRTKSQH